MAAAMGAVRNFWAKQRLAAKIVLVFLPLLVLSLASVSTLGSVRMAQLGDTAVQTSTQLGDQAIADSSRTLQSHQEDALAQLALDQAQLSDRLLARMAAMTDSLAAQAQEHWAHPATGSALDAYPLSSAPPDPKAAVLYDVAPEPGPEAPEDLRRLSPLADTLIALGQSDPQIPFSPAIGTANGVLLGYPWTATLDPAYDPRQRPWYQEAARTDSTVWLPLVDASTGQLNIVAARRITDTHGKVVGVVNVGVTVDIADQILRVVGQQGGYVLLLDSQGQVVVSPALTAGGRSWDRELGQGNLLQSPTSGVRALARQMVAGRQGVRTISLANGDRFVSYAPISPIGWSIAIVEPETEILGVSQRLNELIRDLVAATHQVVQNALIAALGQFAVFVIAVVLVACGATILLARTVTRRAAALAHAARALESDALGEAELRALREERGEDELGLLTRSFVRMAEQVQSRHAALREEVQQLHIDIDRAKAAQQVAEITETEYFQQLQARARQLRGPNATSGEE